MFFLSYFYVCLILREGPVLEGTLRRPGSDPPAMGRHTLHLTTLLRDPTHSTMNIPEWREAGKGVIIRYRRLHKTQERRRRLQSLFYASSLHWISLSLTHINPSMRRLHGILQICLYLDRVKYLYLPVLSCLCLAVFICVLLSNLSLGVGHTNFWPSSFSHLALKSLIQWELVVSCSIQSLLCIKISLF